MNRDTDRERLLADILAETAPTRFREDLLGETLRLAGRRRRVRRLRRATAALAVVGLLGTLAWQVLVTGGTAFPSSAKSYTLVRTVSFPNSAIITTQAFSGNRVMTSIASVAVARTTPDGQRPLMIDDDALLSLIAPRPAALVRLGPHSARLIFVTPDDPMSSEVN